MTSSFLKNFLTAVALPDEVVPMVLANYQDTYAASLAYNQSLGDQRARLASRSLEVNATVALVRSANLAVLDAVLSTRERRDSVIEALLTSWQLTPKDQVRLASRPLSETAADMIVRNPDVCDQAKAIAVLRASKEAHARWVADSYLSDDEIFAHLQKVDLMAGLLETFVPLLLLRPGLRSRALREGPHLLRQAACALEVAPADQEYAAQFALENSSSIEDPQPLIGLLGQPSLRPSIRSDLMGRLGKLRLTSEAAQAGIRPPESRLYTGVPLGDLDDPTRIDDIIDLVFVPPSHRNAQVITGSVLVELSRSQHLGPAQLDRVASALCQLIDEVLSYRRVALVSALCDLAIRLDATQPPERSLARLGLPYSVTREITSRPVRPEPFAEAMAVKYFENPYRFVPRDDLETNLSYTPTKMDYQLARLERLSPEFARQLGRGDTEHSLRCWNAFFGLVAQDPDVPLKTVLTTARQLARSS